MGSEWKCLDDKTKEEYVKMSAKDRERYDTEINEFNTKTKKEKH